MSSTEFKLNVREKARLDRAMKDAIAIEGKSVKDTVERFMIRVMKAGRRRTMSAKKYRDVEQNPNWKKGSKNARYRIVRYTQTGGIKYLPKRNKKKAGDPRVLISRRGLAKQSWTWGLWAMKNTTGRVTQANKRALRRLVRLKRIRRSAEYAIKLILSLSYIKKISPGIERRAINSAVNAVLKIQEKRLAKKLQRKFKK